MKNKKDQIDLTEDEQLDLDDELFNDDFDFNIDDEERDDDSIGQEPPDEVDDTLADDELQEVDVEVLQDTVTDLETIVDNLVIMNKNKELSRVIKLLQSATRFIDEIVSSEDLM